MKVQGKSISLFLLVVFAPSVAFAAAPTATTDTPSNVTASSARLRGSGNPNGAAATGWFRYASTDPGTCNDSFGTRAPASGGSSLGSGSSAVSFNRTISGLTAGTPYYYCAIVGNADGTGFGSVLSFTTADAPSVATDVATDVTSSSVTFNGTAIPNGASSYGFFRFDTINPGACNNSFGTRWPTSSGSDTLLGSGSSPVSFARSRTSLSPGTTYYYCALARNSYGTSWGTVQSFTTGAVAPTVTTSSASQLTGTTAQLNGSTNPNGAAATGWFRYDTVSPGTCNDSFGTRAPTIGGDSLGSGASPVAHSEPISGLTAGTPYYYCAIAQNTEGTGFGSVSAFTTPLPPTATTDTPTSVTASSARLRGSGNPNGAAATGWFRYASTDPGTCNDSFGTRAPASGGSSLGSGSSAVSFNRTISGLTAGTPYYYCAISQNAEGTGFGSVLSFTTDDAPSVTTDVATTVTSSSVTFNGTANPNGASSYGFFRFDTINPGACNNSFGTRWPTSSGSDTLLGSGSSPVSFARSRTGLSPGTTYYYCALARNSYGTSWGTVQSFTTGAVAPTATTSSASQLTGTTAQLNGSTNPNGAAATGWFRYDTVSPGACNDSFGTRAPTSGGDSLGSGASPVAHSEPISGLTAGTPYYYCAIAQNTEGTGFGSVISFTPDDPPAVDSTYPVNGAAGVATYADISITFTEGVTVVSWFAISCDASGTHTAAESGGPITYTLNPDTDFASGELCTVSIYSEGVADIDAYDPPDTMVDDHVFSFTAGPHQDSIFVDGFESGDPSAWSTVVP